MTPLEPHPVHARASGAPLRLGAAGRVDCNARASPVRVGAKRHHVRWHGLMLPSLEAPCTLS